MRLKNSLLVVFSFWVSILFAQDLESLRQQGYEAKQKGDYATAIKYYEQILKAQPDDYDARLAVARLYYSQENYKESVKYFMMIYAADPTDVEALKGLGDNYLSMDKLDEAIGKYQKAIALLPDHIPLYLQLAKAYSWKGDLDKAIETYQKILEIDDTYSEAWQGIGKMYYWKEQPYKAMTYYQKAIALDPEENSIKKEYEDIRKETGYKASAGVKLLNETEENYQINATIQKYGFQKRIKDWLDVSVNVLLDHSNRDFTNTDVGDTIRWYDNTWLKAGWISAHHKVYVYGGYTGSDQKFSSYGINWQSNFSLGAFDFTNSLTGGYDYFYYWNKIGQNKASDNLSIRYKKFGLSLGYQYGLVDKAFVDDVPNDAYFEGTNPYSGFDVSLSYKLLSQPKINISANYSYLNYQYKSRLYYSPMGRQLYGPSVNIYYPFKSFYFYGSYAYNLGSEFYYEMLDTNLETIYLNANNWSANAEIGYDYKALSTSVSANRFFNNFYSNYVLALNLKYSF